MIADTKILTQLASDARSEFFKFERHQDYPDQYPWEPSDAKEFEHLLSLIQNYSPHQFSYKLGDPEFGKELIGYLNDIFGESSNTLNPEVVADYEKYKDEQQAKAEAEVVKKGFDPKVETQKRINAIGQVAKNFQQAQQAEIAQQITDSAETISYQAVLSPETTITSTSQLGFTSTATAAEVSIEIAPLATITYPYSANIESVFLQATSFLPENVPASSVTAIASAVTTLKYCATPTPLTNRDYESLIELVVRTQEAKTGQRIDIPKESITSIANISPVQTPEQIFQTALKTELTKAGASDQAVSGIFKAAPLLYAISSYTPTKSTNSKQEIAGKKSQIFGALSQVVLAQYGIIRPENLQNLSFAWIYSAAQNYYGPDQTFTSRFQNLSVSNPFDNQIVSLFKDQGIGKIKSYVTDTYIQPLATEAFSNFAASGLGQALGFGAKAAVTAGAETATAAAGTAAVVGAEAAAGPPGWVLAAITIAATFGKDILSWLKKQSKNLILLLGGGIALLGGALGMVLAGIVGLGIPGMVIGAGVGAVGFTALTGGSKALSAFAFKVTAFTGALVGLAAVEIGTTVIIIAISIPIVIALILFIINSSALVVPPNDSSFNIQSNIIPPNEQIACTTTVTPLGLPIPSNSVAAKALQIVDHLKQGFWCYWNNSPDYPNLFNYPEYTKYPYHCVYRPGNPSGCSGSYTALDGYSLYWCTWLVIKAYENIGVPSLELGANAMMNSWFKDKGKLVYNASGLITNGGAKISPGDIAFINTPGDPPGYAGHVAIVYAVTSDFVMTIDSNATTKTHSYTVDVNGSLQPQYGLSVIGFGRLP